MAAPVHYRLSFWNICLMVLIAIVVDLLTLIPGVGTVLSPIYWVLMNIFLHSKGFGFVNSRRLATSAIDMIAEMVPVVQELPLITVGTVVLIIFSRIEDRTGVSLHKGKAGLKPSAKQVLNQAGRREPGQGAESSEQDAPSTRNPNTQPLNIDGVRQPN